MQNRGRAINEVLLLWLADADALDDETLADFVAWLSPAERARYQAFLRPLRRRQFLVGRILARQALGMLLERSGDGLCLVEQTGAAPVLAGSFQLSPSFSISHSGRWVGCAASAQGSVGLDIEVINLDRDVSALAEQAFDAAEYEYWVRQPLAQRAPMFYSLWTAKEARFKLQAEGGECVHLRYGNLAIAVCQDRPFAGPPQLELRSLVGS